MCLLAYKPRTIEFPAKWAEAAWGHNPDGFGACWYAEGKLNLRRTLIEAEVPFILAECKDHDAVLHWRFGTHGSKALDNCHPYEAGHYVLAHNGVCTVPITNPLKSDSWHVGQLIKNIAKKKFAVRIIQSYTGKWALIDKRNQQVTLIGKFDEKEGIKLSNLYSIDPDFAWYVSDYPPYFLEDLEKLSRREMKDICTRFPDEVATVISDMFETWREITPVDEEEADAPVDTSGISRVDQGGSTVPLSERSMIPFAEHRLGDDDVPLADNEIRELAKELDSQARAAVDLDDDDELTEAKIQWPPRGHATSWDDPDEERGAYAG